MKKTLKGQVGAGPCRTNVRTEWTRVSFGFGMGGAGRGGVWKGGAGYTEVLEVLRVVKGSKGQGKEKEEQNNIDLII